MADEQVNIVFNAVDHASSAITGIRGAIFSFNQVMQAAEQVYQGVKNVLDQTVGAYAKYADSVQKISQLTNTSTESTSRLITVTERYNVSVDDLTVASRKMATQGLSLTIDTIANLSDEYLKLNTGAERQAFLTKNLGRASAEWTDILSQGSAAILRMNDAVSKNLILTQKQIDAAEKYKLVQKDMKEATDGLKYSLGISLLPSIVAVEQAMLATVNGGGAAFFHLLTGLSDIAGGNAKAGLDEITLASHIAADAINAAGLGIQNLGHEMSMSPNGAFGSGLDTLSGQASDLAGLLDIAFQKLMNIITFGSGFANMTDEEMLKYKRSQQNPGGDVTVGGGGGGGWVRAGPGKEKHLDADGTWSYRDAPNQKYSGGSFSGWAMVGDAPGGATTPYTEFVYAPHGATVFNQSQMSGKSAPPMAGGGIIAGMGGGDVLNELKKLRNDLSDMPRQMAQAVAKAPRR
jgi:hypothetical protein